MSEEMYKLKIENSKLKAENMCLKTILALIKDKLNFILLLKGEGTNE